MTLRKLFLFLSAAFLLALGLLAVPMPGALAQTPTSGNGKMEGQVVEGTKDGTLSLGNGVTITLYTAPAGATTTISQTAQTDPNGRFSFSNLDTITTTRYLLMANYMSVNYFSDILSFAQNQTTLPVTMTVYETTTEPSVVQVAQTHVVFDVQTRQFNVLQIVALQNNSDRTYVGNTAIGPHRISLTLPFLAGAQNIEFDNPEANDSTIRGDKVMSYTLPIVPGSDQIVYNYTLPFTPPSYSVTLTLPFDTAKFQLLLADVGATIQSAQLSAPAPFPTQGGTNFILSSADNVKAGTTVSATIANLPATVAEPTPGAGSPSAPAPVPTSNNLQVVGGIVLGIAALAAIGLLVYPIMKRRNAQAARAMPSATANRRLELLQEMADLDDDYEAQKISETEYRERRARLKAELLDLTQGEE